MTWLITKYLLTAGMVVFISEVAKRSDKLGGFIAALPLMTLLTLTWLYIENHPEEKIANHAYYTFWYVIPTLPMFLLFPYLLPKLELSLLLKVLSFGILTDSLLMYLGFLDFRGTWPSPYLSPAWMWALWLLVANSQCGGVCRQIFRILQRGNQRC